MKGEARKMKLKDKVAMVTGAAQGIGRGVALEYAKNGAKLAIMDINGLKLSDTAKEIESLGVSCIQMTGDVSDTEAVQLFVKTTVEQLGSIDVLTHAAGILRSCAVVDQDESDWDTVIAVNLRSTFLFGKYVGRQMTAQGSGAMVLLMLCTVLPRQASVFWLSPWRWSWQSSAYGSTASPQAPSTPI